jgi:ribokinase
VTTAVVGHVEWIEFARVDRVPGSGEIVHATDTWEEVGGGGAVAAVQLAKLAGSCDFLTALGDDALGARSRERLEELGVRVHANMAGRTRRALTHLEPAGERTITTLGPKLVPRRADPLPWDLPAKADAVYFVVGDAPALETARGARVLVATSRDLDTLVEAGVELDALVGSGVDIGERYPQGAIDPEPRLVARTAGAGGGEYVLRDGSTGPWRAAPLPGPVADAYGCGDSFAAGLTFALADGRAADDALAFASRCGAACMTGNGPFEGQLTADRATTQSPDECAS